MMFSSMLANACSMGGVGANSSGSGNTHPAITLTLVSTSIGSSLFMASLLSTKVVLVHLMHDTIVSIGLQAVLVLWGEQVWFW